ncbi:hypothetical protein AAVH_25460 [Aphelenchoides avenae]|nr:hypothetical protein AAVH_25460 [Aphelenchus avenae]
MGQGGDDDDGRSPIIVGPPEEIPGQTIGQGQTLGPAGFPEETESHESEDGPVPIFQQYPLVSCSLCKTFWQIIEPSAQPMNVQVVRLALKEACRELVGMRPRILRQICMVANKQKNFAKIYNAVTRNAHATSEEVCHALGTCM